MNARNTLEGPRAHLYKLQPKPIAAKGFILRGKFLQIFMEYRKPVLTSDVTVSQCDQIGRKFSIWATLGYFLLNQLSPKQVVSTRGLL